VALLVLVVAAVAEPDPQHFDVIVVGGTPSGVAAAVAAVRMGERVLLLEPGAHLGGVMSSGLGATDFGRYRTIGGLAKEFFDRVMAYYERAYGVGSAQAKACRRGFYFEPHVAEAVYDDWVADQPRLTVLRRHRLTDVERVGDKIVAVTVEDLAHRRSLRFSGEVFIDALYEGDLMAMAKVAYRVGREGRNEYDEPHGLGSPGRSGDADHGDHKIQAYTYRLCLTDDPAKRRPVSMPAGYDPRVYATCRAYAQKMGAKLTFSPCAFALSPLPNDKADANSGIGGGQGSDMVGASWGYPDADYAHRADIAAAHRRYVQGLLYFWQNDPSVPAEMRAEARRWGLAGDEFGDNDNWPPQMYVREARRMVGRYVMREQDVTTSRFKPDAIGLGSYDLDMHGVERVELPGGRYFESGGIWVPSPQPYEIPYGSLVPRDVANLLVTVDCSATNVAYATLRMEPVYLILGHAAGVAAHLAHYTQRDVQDVSIADLQRLLTEQGQVVWAERPPKANMALAPGGPVKANQTIVLRDVTAKVDSLTDRQWDLDGKPLTNQRETSLSLPLGRTYDIGLRVRDGEGAWSERTHVAVPVQGGPPALPECLLDDSGAKFTGRWSLEAARDGVFGPFMHVASMADGARGHCAAVYRLALAGPGRYDVEVSYPADVVNATNATVIVRTGVGADQRLRLDERRHRTWSSFEYLGTWTFRTTATVEILNEGADGVVVADAVRLVYAGP
jgi:hypothetical protein